MLGWFYYTMEIRLGREVRRAKRCSVWFSDSFLPNLQPPPLSLTHTRPGGQLSWLLLLLLPEGCQADGLLISRTIIRAGAVYHAVCSQQGPSASNGPCCGAPLHLSFSPPHLKHHRSPRHPSLVPGAMVSGGGGVQLLPFCQHWIMFLTGVALLMSPSFVLSVSPQQQPSGNEDECIIVLVTSDTYMRSIFK